MSTESGSGEGDLSISIYDDSVIVFVDESYKPMVAAAAVSVESGDAQRLNSIVSDAYVDICGWHQLQGLRTFDQFVRDGFHAANNPPEIYNHFVSILADTPSFKSHIVFSNRSKQPEMSDKRRLMVIFSYLVRDVVATYRNRPVVTFCFESSKGMDRYVERAVAQAVDSLQGHLPRVEVQFGTKRSPHLLSISDYVLHIFNKWWWPLQGGTAELNAAEWSTRSFRAILGSVSMARSIDDGTVVRRTLQ